MHDRLTKLIRGYSDIRPMSEQIIPDVDKTGDDSTNEIPAKYCDPPILKDESGKRTGCPIADILNFDLDEVVNLYEFKNDTFKFYYTENDSSCDSGNPTLAMVECGVDGPAHPGIRVTFDNVPFVEWGINYLGKIVVQHPGNS